MQSDQTSLDLQDAARNRLVPTELYFPARHCTPAVPCPVAFISPGYGLAHTDYSFLARSLASDGYLVVAIQHVLPTDPPLATTGTLFDNRMPMWRRGVENLRFVKATLQVQYPGYDWSRLVLIGHSNGGDLSALALVESPTLATTLITLDHRRYPLPRGRAVRTLSLRGTDFAADPGVLPTPSERSDLDACIVRLDDARHNDMYDAGPAWLKDAIAAEVGRFLHGARCSD